MKRVERYINAWMQCGYSDDIPDEVPNELMQLGIAPSYKAIAIAILKNDIYFHSLGFPATPTPWYYALKSVQFKDEKKQYELFL